MSADQEYNKFTTDMGNVSLNTASHISGVSEVESQSRNDLEQKKFDSTGKIRIVTDI